MRTEKRIYEKAMLVELLNSKHSCLVLKPCNRRIELQPKYLKEVSLGIKESLDQCLNKYDYSLNGILLDYQHISVLLDDNSGRIVGKCGEFVVSVKGEFFVFQPEIGNLLRGVVNVKSDNHVGCLVHKRFNAVILKPDNVEPQDWNCSKIQIGDEIVFEIVDHVLSGHVPFIEGRIAGEYLEKKLRKTLKKSKRIRSSGEHSQHNGNCSVEDVIVKNTKEKTAEFGEENLSCLPLKRKNEEEDESPKISPKKKKYDVETERKILTPLSSQGEKKKKMKKDKIKSEEKERNKKKSKKSRSSKIEKSDPADAESLPTKKRKVTSESKTSPEISLNFEPFSSSILMEVVGKREVQETDSKQTEAVMFKLETNSQKGVKENVKQSAKTPKLEKDDGLKQRLIHDMLQVKVLPSEGTFDKPITTSTPKSSSNILQNEHKKNTHTVSTPKSVVNSPTDKGRKQKKNRKSKSELDNKKSEDKERKSMINALLDSVKQSLGMDDVTTKNSNELVVKKEGEIKKEGEDLVLQWLRKSGGKPTQKVQQSSVECSGRLSSADSGFNSLADKHKV